MIWFADLAEFENILAQRVDVDLIVPELGVAWSAWDVAAKTRRVYEAYDYLKGGPFTLPEAEDVAAATPDLKAALALFAYRLTSEADLLDTITAIAAQTKPRQNYAEVTHTANLVRVYGTRVLALTNRYRRPPVVGQDLF